MPMRRSAFFLLAVCLATPVAAQDRTPSHRIALAQAPGLEVIHRANFGTPVEDGKVRIRYLILARDISE